MPQDYLKKKLQFLQYIDISTTELAVKVILVNSSLQSCLIISGMAIFNPVTLLKAMTKDLNIQFPSPATVSVL